MGVVISTTYYYRILGAPVETPPWSNKLLVSELSPLVASYVRTCGRPWLVISRKSSVVLELKVRLGSSIADVMEIATYTCTAIVYSDHRGSVVPRPPFSMESLGTSERMIPVAIAS